MNADLSLILELQEVDLARDALLKKRNGLPACLREIEKALASKKSLVGESRSHLEALKKSRVQREKDLDLAVSKLESRAASLKALKSNEAYTAALRELEQTRKANAVIEDEILNLMEEIESVSAQVTEMEKAVRRQEDDLAIEQKRVQEAARDLDAGIAEVESRSRSLAERTDPTLLADYQRARSKRGGLGLAQAVDGTCRACHMEIPPQMYNELIKGTTYHYCPSCQRVLYYREEQAPAETQVAQPGTEA